MRTAELTVLCEGRTEMLFVEQVLRPHLSLYRVHARPQYLVGERGGIVPFDKLRAAHQRFVGNLRSHQFLTTMVDLYALREFPGDERRSGEAPVERVARIEGAMRERLPSPQFLPYVQLHEFEALVFVDLDALSPEFPGEDLAEVLRKLRTEVGALAPEEIDDSPRTAPSKRLIRVIPGYEALKATAGAKIAGRIGLTRLRESCPHFAAWLSRLEALAGG
ncbi:MAG: DUF4276 family protein [Planctomycetes bacterium]|nr:DUF4276 family protein [Planctomycetota bacterium]